MIDGVEDNNEIPTGSVEETTAATSGKGKSGKSGGTAGGGIRLPPTKMKEVMATWQHFDANEVMAQVAEFFSELPARASAHVQVSWANLQNQGFAIVTQIIKVAKEISHLMLNLTRENVEILKHRYGVSVTTGPSG